MSFFEILVNSWHGRLALTRRVKFAGVALIGIFVWLLFFYAIGLCPRLLPGLATINNTYGLYVRLTNAIVALMCAAFMLWPREGGKLVGGWTEYIGLAFLTFVVQYSFRSADLVLVDSSIHEISYWVTMAVVFLTSPLNNLLFLAASRVLLNKKKHREAIRKTHTSPGIRGYLKDTLTELFQVALPKWAWVVFPVSVLGLFAEPKPYLAWARLPDAIVSVYCLSWLGYALYLSFYIRNQKMLARVAFVLVLAYGAGQIVYAGNPVISQALRPGSFLVKWSTETLGRDPSRALSAKSLDDLDGALFAVLFPMKYLLFLPAFILYLLSVISVNDFRRALRATTSKRADYLSRDGILSVVGESLEADEVKLLIRLPGVGGSQEPDGEMVLDETWTSLCTTEERRIYPVQDHPLLIKAMQTEGETLVFTNEDIEMPLPELLINGPGLPQTLTLIPVKFHGGVIGVLRVIFRGFGKYNEGTLEQLKFMAELIAPSVQDFRTVSAVEKLGLCFSQTQVENPTDNFKDASEKMVGTLYDLLNPLAIGLTVQLGFTPFKLISAKKKIYCEILEELNATVEQQKTVFESTPERKIRIETDQLSGWTEKGEPYYPGTLMLAIPADKDNFDEPTLGAYYLTRQMVASLTANGIFNVARNSLGLVIEDLGISLNEGMLSIDEWIIKLTSAIEKSGLLWMVVSTNNCESFRGQREYVAIITGLTPDEKDDLISISPHQIPYSSSTSNTHHIIHLNLGKPQHHLFLGVERENFGSELTFQSPWKEFLEKLASVAGVALVSIEDREETEARRRMEAEERLKAAKEEPLKTIALISAMLMHQLVNMVKNQLDTADHLLELLAKYPLAKDDQFFKSLLAIRESAEMMQGLTNACTNITRMDKTARCSIEEAVQQAESLFQFDLQKRKINIQKYIERGIEAKVQPRLVSLALASLIGNAIDAIKAKGRIEISASVEDGFVMCHIVDTGAPIPAEIKSNLFQPGTTGKNGHSGWGLYLVSRSLRDYGGDISLTYSNADATCFTLRLPTSSNGSSH